LCANSMTARLNAVNGLAACLNHNWCRYNSNVRTGVNRAAWPTIHMLQKQDTESCCLRKRLARSVLKSVLGGRVPTINQVCDCRPADA
jgi:hypothetical protein